MKYNEDLLFLFDGSIFDFVDKNGKKYRACLEGIDDFAATEEALALKSNGEPKYPIIFEAITEKNPDLISNSSFVLELSLKNDEESFEPVGLAIISENWWVKNSFHINELAISSSVQNIGLGTLIMQHIQEAAYIAGKDAITLQCYKDDFESEEVYEARQSFYESLGFEPHFDIVRQLMVYSITGDIDYRKTL